MKIIAPLLLSLSATAVAAPTFVNAYRPTPTIQFVVETAGQPPQLARLWGNRATGPAGTYLKVPGKWEAPSHAHTANYRAVVVQGLWSHWVPKTGEGKGTKLPVGSYWTQKADQPHKDACLSNEECIILLTNDRPYRTYLVK